MNYVFVSSDFAHDFPFIVCCSYIYIIFSNSVLTKFMFGLIIVWVVGRSEFSILGKKQEI